MDEVRPPIRRAVKQGGETLSVAPLQLAVFFFSCDGARKQRREQHRERCHDRLRKFEGCHACIAELSLFCELDVSPALSFQCLITPRDDDAAVTKRVGEWRGDQHYYCLRGIIRDAPKYLLPYGSRAASSEVRGLAVRGAGCSIV